ncbi:MAG: pantoate--beta-alanine ligase, partial [Candidatus Hinthialibacter sp.]
GFLHEGHLSLIRIARERCDIVVVSCFVNPTQFVPGEDFERYPRDENRDLALLKKEGVDYVLLPTSDDLYPEGFSTYVLPPAPSQGWCGRSRPGHFQGVCTIVSILFNLVQPHFAYFGRKDAQQCAVIQSMTRDLNFPIEIVVCPIVRDSDGLAMSSRNVYLSTDERRRALTLSQTLRLGLSRFQQGVVDAEAVLAEGKKQIQAVDGVRLDYLGVVNQNTFKSVSIIQAGHYYIGAIYVGTTRLIDNMVFGLGEAYAANHAQIENSGSPRHE